MKTVEIEVAASGEIKIEAVGFKGEACLLATRAIEQALGKGTDKKTRDFYVAEDSGQKVRQ